MLGSIDDAEEFIAVHHALSPGRAQWRRRVSSALTADDFFHIMSSHAKISASARSDYNKERGESSTALMLDIAELFIHSTMMSIWAVKVRLSIAAIIS